MNSTIIEVESYLKLRSGDEPVYENDLLKRCLEQMKNDDYWMTEIRSTIRPIIANAPLILEFSSVITVHDKG